MANLRGSTLDKQVNNAFHRLESFGVKRHGSNDHLTHSDAVASKREMYLRDFKNFMENNQIDGKLNQAITAENMDKFLEQRMENLSRTSREDYTRGWSSMVQGLQESNISVGLDKSYFDQRVAEIKELPSSEIKMNRAIQNVEAVIKDLYKTRYESGVIADIQNELGLRVSEAFQLVKNPEKYIEHGAVTGITGKGGREYASKKISPQLEAKIMSTENIPSQSTYRNDLSNATNGNYTPHSFRFGFAKKMYESTIKDGQYHSMLKQVSEGLGHSREAMTNYYLKRA